MAETYKFKRKPYKHQVQALKKLFENGWGGALLMEPRTGKTKVCVDYASILHQKGKCARVLVVCPVGVIDVWLDEIKANCPFRWRVTIWDKDGRKEVALPKWGSDYLDFVLINYDAFSTPGKARGRTEEGHIKRSRTRGGRYDVIKAVKRWQPHMIVLDESHRIKSASARKAVAIRNLGPIASYRVIATGTAVTKKKRVFDLYMQWKFLNPSSPLVYGKDLQDFKEEFGVWTRRKGYPQWLRERNSKRLHRLVHAESFAVARDECYDLPAAFPNQVIHVDLEESAPVYDAMAEDMVAKIKSGEITQASIKLVQGLRLSQITSGLAKTEPSEQFPEGRLVRIGSEKLRMLESLLEDWLEQDEKMVICARFRGDILGIAKLCQKMGVEPQVIFGGISRDDRTQAIKNFREREGGGVFVMNPQASSEGIDLRSAATMIWYSLGNSYVNYAQARDRIALSPRAVRHVFLLGRNTYDELQYESLQEDGDVVKAIMASPERLLRNFK